jgi:hypothetical protein
MVAESGQSSIPARKLAERLRALREREFQPLTQDQLAIGLGGEDRLSSTVISHWEKPNADRLPPQQRLDAYARLFCTSRSFASGDPRMLPEEELTDQERRREAELKAELRELRDRTLSTGEALLGTGQPSSIWYFSDKEEEAVSIVCPEAPDPPSYARRDHLNYTHLAQFADLDALMEILQQVKAVNPKRAIRIMRPEELKRESVLEHLILIGGAVVEVATPASADTHKVELPVLGRRLFASDIPLPVARSIPGTETHRFDCRVGDEKREFTSTRDSSGALTHDIGLIGRCPHPMKSGKTVTVLSGITSRGVHGAAQCFTDSDVRDENERYLRDTYASTDKFCLLMQVPVLNDVALPPELWRDDTVVYAWSEKTGARW